MRHPNVPEALDGWAILHRMFSFDRARWDALDPSDRGALEYEARGLFASLAGADDTDCGLVQLLGHKGDLMVTHYARTFDALGEAQIAFDKTGLRGFLQPRDSYVSILELGLYEHTAKIHGELAESGLKPHAAEWNDAFDAKLAEHALEPRNAARLFAGIPQRRYACFYPMDKKREGGDNWYSLPYAERAKMMTEHGKVGRSWHGRVTQVISGSIGFDDHEWGVDLYADDPLTFKRLVYEMRFDEASARFGEFGAFWSGMQFSISQLGVFLNGTGSPALVREELASSGV